MKLVIIRALIGGIGLFKQWVNEWTKKAVVGGRQLFAPQPESCAICNRMLKGAAKPLTGVCRQCNESMPWISEACCQICGRGEACTDCTRRTQTYFIRSRSAVHYTESMKQLLALYKYRGDERKEQVLVQMLRHACGQLLGSAGRRQVDYVTYVPLSPERLSERGFNQAERLAREVSRYCGAPVVSLLERTRHTGKQSYKSRSERLADMRSAFRLCEDEWKRIANEHPDRRLHIIVVDDVYTTGSTLNSCAKQITERLPADVYGITWAR